MVRYRHITTDDPTYAQEKDLRNRVLRIPLGLELSDRDLDGEDRQIHIIAEDDDGKVIGCVLVAFTGQQAKVRQIAVDGVRRGQGIGRSLMRRAEEAVQARHGRTAMLYARVSARRFFERLGYAVVSAEFTEVTIPHVRMEKKL
jgi:predicted GNAT family N-acyltransferase